MKIKTLASAFAIAALIGIGSSFSASAGDKEWSYSFEPMERGHSAWSYDFEPMERGQTR